MLMVTHMGIQPWKRGLRLAGVADRNRQGGLSDSRVLTVQPAHSGSKNGQTRRGLCGQHGSVLRRHLFQAPHVTDKKTRPRRGKSHPWAHSEALVQPGWDLRGKTRPTER